MNIPSVFWLVPVASCVALGMAWFFFRQMMKEDEGTPRMKEIALYVRKGAMAYLKQQYKVVSIVFVVFVCLLDGWFLLRTGRLLWYEDRYLRISTYR